MSPRPVRLNSKVVGPAAMGAVGVTLIDPGPAVTATVGTGACAVAAVARTPTSTATATPNLTTGMSDPPRSEPLSEGTLFDNQGWVKPGTQVVPANGTRAIAAASSVSATRSSGSRLCTCDLPQPRASVWASSTIVRR